MAGLVPAIHDWRHKLAVSVDARHKAGHDDHGDLHHRNASEH
jgi:hypothetical protein